MFSKRWIWILILTAYLVEGQAAPFTKNDTDSEQPDVFSHQDIRVEAYQTVDRLLVTSADVVVAGSVNEGIIVVDGNLTITPEARIRGKIIVLGGYAESQAGAYLEDAPWVIGPQGVPLTKILVGILSLLITAGLIAIPYSIWAITYILRDVPLYLRLKSRLLEIQRRWPALYMAIALVFSGAMLFAFSILAWQTVFRHTMGIFDNMLIWLVRYFATPGLDRVMIIITNLGFGNTYRGLVAASLVVLAVLRRWLEIKGLVICLLGGAVLNELLKHMFARARPEVFRLVEASGYSFPSGHAMVSLCFYGMIAFLVARNIHSWHWRIAVIISAILLVFGIGVSRIYLGVHYPSDVVAGYAAGATWLAFSISLLMWWERNRLRPISERQN